MIIKKQNFEDRGVKDRGLAKGNHKIEKQQMYTEKHKEFRIARVWN